MGREREEKTINVTERHPLITSHMYPDQGWDPQLKGMCPDQELKPQNFDVQNDTPTN